MPQQRCAQRSCCPDACVLHRNALADTNLMPCGIAHRPDCRRLVGVRELTRAHTHTHMYTHMYTHTRTHTHIHTCTHVHTHTHTHTRTRTQAAWHNFMEARSCLHGTKVASPCQRLTFAPAHTPECTPASVCCDGVKHAQHLHSNTPILTPRLRGQECAAALFPRASTRRQLRAQRRSTTQQLSERQGSSSVSAGTALFRAQLLRPMSWDWNLSQRSLAQHSGKVIVCAGPCPDHTCRSAEHAKMLVLRGTSWRHVCLTQRPLGTQILLR